MKLYTLLLLVFVASCAEPRTMDMDTAKKGIADTEKAFETMAKEKGIAEAFAFYADNDAVIRRKNDSLIKGKDAIRNFYSAPFYKTATVTWSPDFIETSPDGGLGYTYGKYTWQSTDSAGKLVESRGIFHTVWKRQEDGSWRYVWD